MKLSVSSSLVTALWLFPGLMLPASARSIVKHRQSDVVTSGRLFEIDGKVQYFAGTNAWWLGHILSDTDLETAMSQIAETGYKTVRTWGFGNVNVPAPDSGSVYFQVLNTTLYSSGQEINYGSNGIGRLDAVVTLAEKYNVKLILALLNNWDDLGGINTYVNAFGGNATSFYTNAAAQTAYRNYVEFVVNRYKNSSAIFSWELCNEPRCRGCDSSVIYDWATTTSQFIKSLDGTHLVTLGDEGWLCEGDGTYAYSCGEGVDFTKNLRIETLDYGVFHIYPDSWGYDYTWANQWILEHDAIGAAAGKPVILEEYGAPLNHTAIERPWQLTVVNGTQIASDSIWQFGTEAVRGYGDVNSIYYGEDEYAVLGTQHAAEMLAKSVT